MPPKIAASDITACFSVTLKTLEVLAVNLNTPFLEVISATIQSLLENIGAVKQNKNECSLLMEQAYSLLDAIVFAHMKLDTGGELPVNILHHIGRFGETLHKIHTFVEAQQSNSKIRRFFRQGEMNILLRDCKTGLQQGLDFFQIKSVNVMKDIAELHEESRKRYQEVLNMVETLSDTSSDQASTIGGVYSRSQNSSSSISMLPPEPKIFHGRDSELSEILKLFHQTTPRIAILGAGGMGKTSLAQAAVHHPEIVARYHHFRFFVACDSASTKSELVALIGAHLQLKPGKDLTQMVVNHFFGSPPTLLILDNFETLWEPLETRKDIEEFLSLLTDIKHLALMITMRGAERPAKVLWSRPFLQPLPPLEHDAALHMFLDITDYNGDQREIDQVLSLTDNMPLAINLLAHLADSEGCTHVLSHWEQEKNHSDLRRPRINAVPGAQELLSLLSILPDGLSDVELVQSKLPIVNIRSCKAALIGTALAYIDKQKRIKVLLPIREYIHSVLPPGDSLIQPLLVYFQELLELYKEFHGTHSNSGIVAQISSNYANIQNAYFVAELLGSWEDYPVSKCQILIAEVFEHFKDFDDDDLKCRFYLNVAGYYREMEHKPLCALENTQNALSLATATGNKKRQAESLQTLAWMRVFVGDYVMARLHLSESLRLARASANFYQQAQALQSDAICTMELGYYENSILACNHARKLLSLCGMSKGTLDHETMSIQAQVHKYRSEYIEAHNINTLILEETSMEQDPINHGYALLVDALIDTFLGVSKEGIQKKLDVAAGIFSPIRFHLGAPMCDSISAILLLNQGNTVAAKLLLEKCLESFYGHHPGMVLHCLELLSDMSRWHNAPNWQPNWPTVFLVHSLKSNQKLGIYQALQFIGDVFLVQNDENTAVSLFTIALEGFTHMDVHRSKAECMLRLGDICKQNHDLTKATEHWTTARPLFERSSQGEQVANIDKRLASVEEDVLEQHRNNLAWLAIAGVPAVSLDDLSVAVGGGKDQPDMGDEVKLRQEGVVGYSPAQYGV
ncbi:hypothetical protein B0H14DRAFT_3156281 [Mycena olivaceomarginata]|nr:hypothetical protein B0H14DRAFT_3156281 [Mycena olivaceomarginata]